MTLVAAPVTGALSDRLGRKPVIAVSYALIALLIYPAFLLPNAFPTLPTLLGVLGVLGALNSGGGAPAIVSLAEVFPSQAPAAGKSLVYAVGVAIFGGPDSLALTLRFASSAPRVKKALAAQGPASAPMALRMRRAAQAAP